MSFFTDLFKNGGLQVHQNAFQKGVVVKMEDEEEIDTSSEEDYDMEEENETQLYIKSEMDKYGTRATGEMMEVTGANDDIDSVIMNYVTVPQAFQQYKFDTYHKQDLIIDQYRDKIVGLSKGNSVLIIQGPTGCGKTTQVPQFILDSCRANNLPCNIIVTQPRRIAAINIAQRVCQERGWGMGTVCGYQVGFDNKTGMDTILTYATTEVLLQKLISQRDLNHYTHVIIDEVHERSKSLDFLLLLVRKYLNFNSKGVRVILMSATMEAHEFAHYFRRKVNQHYINAPILPIKKDKGGFNITTYYIDQLKDLAGEIPSFTADSPSIDPKVYEICLKLLLLFETNFRTVEQKSEDRQLGSVLIFLPGYHEISVLTKMLEEEILKNKIRWEIHPMHSSLPSDQLAKAFSRPKIDHRKIIIATNIAESSLTVSDVRYVIDFCLTKNMKVNPDTQFSCLSLEWASHNNCDQRAGRVGRVADGRVYRLVPREFYKNLLNNTTPEMQRAPLENIILYMKMLDLHDTPKNILSLALSPPDLNEVESCIWKLKEIGALLLSCNGKNSSQDGDLTFLGRVMGSLPIDVQLSKLIVLGHMFNVLDETIIIATGCMVQNLFAKPFNKDLEIYERKLTWSDNSKSDLITLLNLYKVYKSEQQSHRINSLNAEYQWCRENYVNFKGLREWNVLYKEIYNRLQKFKFEIPTRCHTFNLTTIEKPTILKIVICGAFYPNYFARSEIIDLREAVRCINGRDPMRTVYFKNMKSNQPSYIYSKQIKKRLGIDRNCHIGVEHENDTKLLIEFKEIVTAPELVVIDGEQRLATVLNNIPPEIYILIKRRMIYKTFPLHIMPDDEAKDFAKNILQKNNDVEEQTIDNDYSFSKDDYSLFTPIPSLDIEYISVSVMSIVDVSHFYCHSTTRESQKYLNTIFRILNDPATDLQPINERLEINKVYVGRYKVDNSFYRCKLINYTRIPNIVNVHYIDWGNYEQIHIRDLFKLPNINIMKLAPIAFCCTLSGIQPSLVFNPKSIWSKKVNEFFEARVTNRQLNAKVYSVVDDVVHLELFSQNDFKKTFNDCLVDTNFAIRCDESYQSKLDHERRIKALSSDNAKFNIPKTLPTCEFEEPKIDYCNITVELSGPFSPLESKVHGLLRSINTKDVKIESGSVNSVFLDDYPADSHMRLIVATHVSANERVSLRQTTVMPNIAGFPMIMALMFCPTAEMKVNKEGTKVCSILCGLGAKEGTSKACYPEHDLIMKADVNLEEKIIHEINNIRFHMNSCLKIMNNIYEEITNHNELIEHQMKLKEDLFKLLHWKKEDILTEDVKYYDCWNKTECNDIEILRIKIEDEEKVVWPMLLYMELKKENIEQNQIKRNLDELLQVARNLIEINTENPITCELCNERLITKGAVMQHIFSSSHKKKVSDFENKPSIIID